MSTPIVELRIDQVWTDFTDLAYTRDDLTITRGRADEAAQVDRSAARWTANNRDGNLSPRNPTGLYYGKIGRNTPCRVRLADGPDAYLLCPTTASSLSTPDSAGLSITGDIDIRIDVQPDRWSIEQGLANKASAGVGQKSWALALRSANTVGFRWTADGSTVIDKTSTAAVSVPAGGRLAIRVTLDVDNGAGGNTVTFYTAPTISGPWVQLGAAVVTAGTTSIFDGTAPVQVATSNFNISNTPMTGRVYAFELRQGINGTLRADVDPAEEEPGQTSFTDSTGNLWTLAGDTSIVDPRIRFLGEISEWPQRWDRSGNDVYVPIEASGILRRLGQGQTPLKSTLYRALTSLPNPPRAYWPCEDGEQATELASALGGPPMRFFGATPKLAAFDGFASSQPLPTVSGSHWLGAVPSYTGNGTVQVWWLMHIPAGAASDGQRILWVYTTGTAAVWVVQYATGGGLTLRAFDADGVQLLSSTGGFTVDDHLVRVRLTLDQNGANVDWTLQTIDVGGIPVGISDTLNSRTVSRAYAIRVLGLTGDCAIGHIAVHDEILDLFGQVDQLNAYAGEPAGRRIQRLCADAGIPLRTIGDLDASSRVGPQRPAELLTLVREAADVDGGILYEPRDLLGLAYRTRDSLCHQDPRLELDYAAAHLSSIEPTDDDQHALNDITVRRDGGASARAVKTSGPLSILPPPSGVGVYDAETTLNVEGDGQLPDQAGFRLHLGTVDEARYPVLGVQLARQVFTSNPALQDAALDLDIGDRVTVDNPPPWLPPDPISQLAQGMTETYGEPPDHRLDVNCSPESPWGAAAIYDDGQSRYSSDGSTLAVGVDADDTSLSVATAAGPLWSHADGDFQIRVGGEVMTVTNITGATSPQTFTATRSVNGVSKSHLAGVEVALAHPRVYVP